MRDGIPELIAAGGHVCVTRVLEQEEYITQLRAKLREEAEEYLREDNDRLALEELADVLEVIRALADIHGASPEMLEQIRADKAGRRGGFQERILLLRVEDGS